MKIGVCGNSTIQHKYKNCYFFRKSSGIMYLALAVAPATWYNNGVGGQGETVDEEQIQASFRSAYVSVHVVQVPKRKRGYNYGF